MGIEQKISPEQHQKNLEQCEKTGCYVGIYELEPNGPYGTCIYFQTPKCKYKIITDDCDGEIHLCQRWKYDGKTLVKKTN